MLEDPCGVQDRQLREILTRNQDCEYGKHHGFATIADYAEFTARVPVVDYDQLRPQIERMADGADGVLLTDPVLAFEQTGGSSGGSKLVAYTEASLAAFRRGLLPWLDDLYLTYPTVAAGTAYWSVSPACRERRDTRGGIPIGLPSDVAYFGSEIAPQLVASLSVPPIIGLVRDVDLWRHLTVFYLLADVRLSLISVWSPTFLIDLLHYARQNADVLATCIEDGAPALDVPAAIRPHLAAVAPSAQRACHVAGVLAGNNDWFAGLWPDLTVISCWDQAASRSYADEVRRLFPGVHLQGKGLLATEGITSIPLGGFPMPVLALESGFYEFLGADGVLRRAHEVTSGADYELVLTNHCGLYRYAIGDRVRIHGFAGQTPMLEFTGRSGVSSDLCGEKFDEVFVLRVVRRLGLRFAVLAPQTQSPRGYVLLLDGSEVSASQVQGLAASADASLAANPQYAYACRLQQLMPLRAVRCIDPVGSWTKRGLARGQRLGDIKLPVLIAAEDWQRTFLPVA